MFRKLRLVYLIGEPSVGKHSIMRKMLFPEIEHIHLNPNPKELVRPKEYIYREKYLLRNCHTQIQHIKPDMNLFVYDHENPKTIHTARILSSDSFYRNVPFLLIENKSSGFEMNDDRRGKVLCIQKDTFHGIEKVMEEIEKRM